MLDSMEELIRSQHMIPRGSAVLCAVSGGADSVCLLHALYHLRPLLGFSLAAAHFDHRLRGDESTQDAAFVAQFVDLCCGPQRLPDGRVLPAVRLYSGSGDVAGEAQRRGTGLEETAREMRYAFLRDAARQAGAELIATAHNSDDNVETILFHLARGTGLRGLTGILPAAGNVIRPLLTTSRRQIEEYLYFYGLPHREDRTNRDDAYARNRIRHQVTPVLEELFPGVADRMANTAELLRTDEDCLTQLARQAAERAAVTADTLTIPAADISSLHEAVASRAIRLMIARLNGGDQDCAAVHLKQVAALCRNPDPSAQIDLPYGLTARREYGNLVLTTRPNPTSLAYTPVLLPGQTAAGGWTIDCAREEYLGQPQSSLEFWLDCELAPQLNARPRREGDRLSLPGRPTKSVKKWLIEEKIPRLHRDALPVLDCGGRPAAVARLGPDSAFLPQPGRRAWHITLIPNP